MWAHLEGAAGTSVRDALGSGVEGCPLAKETWGSEGPLTCLWSPHCSLNAPGGLSKTWLSGCCPAAQSRTSQLWAWARGGQWSCSRPGLQANGHGPRSQSRTAGPGSHLVRPSHWLRGKQKPRAGRNRPRVTQYPGRASVKARVSSSNVSTWPPPPLAIPLSHGSKAGPCPEGIPGAHRSHCLPLVKSPESPA